MLTDTHLEAGERPTTAPVTVLVVLENELACHGLVSMLRSVPSVGAVWSCGRVDTAFELLSRHRPDVVICRGSGESAPAVVRATCGHDARALLLLEDLQLDAIDESILATAHGFLLQGDVTVAMLQDAVDKLRAGDMPLPPALARTLIARVRGAGAGPSPRHVSLTPRERDVLGLLAQGYSNKQIARRLAISEHAVKRHVTNLLAKLNCPNRTLAVALALREGLIGLTS